MDIKKELMEKIEEIADKIKSDKDIAAKFQKDPVGTVEKLIGIDLPNDQIQAAVDMIRAKVDLDKLGSALDGLKGLFGK